MAPVGYPPRKPVIIAIDVFPGRLKRALVKGSNKIATIFKTFVCKISSIITKNGNKEGKITLIKSESEKTAPL
jgi:hypothetical protein